MLIETQLYAPVCSYLKAQGYVVKAEVKHCDVVAIRDGEPPLIVELKTRLNLELIMQAADRLRLTDQVYIAFPASAPLWRKHWRRLRVVCQRLGIGVMTLENKTLAVKVRLSPAPYQPRRSHQGLKRLQSEFERRIGDHNVGGSSKRKIMTAYRQNSLRCAVALREGPLSVAEIREQLQLKQTASILQKNHYQWFERVQRGIYQLTPAGIAALQEYALLVSQLSDHAEPV